MVWKRAREYFFSENDDYKILLDFSIESDQVIQDGRPDFFVVDKLNRIWKIIRSSHQRCSIKKGILRNFAKFTEKHLCQNLFFNKVVGLKMRLWHRCFPVNYTQFLRAPFLQNTSGRLLLKFILKSFYDEQCNYKWI